MSDDWGDAPFIPARPTLYKGIRMRSRLEASFAEFLDRQQEKWAYEPECFAGDGGQWLPDFEILTGTPGRIFVEIKPYGLLPEWGKECRTRVSAIMRRMEIARQTEPRCTLWLFFWGYSEDDESLLMMSIHGNESWEVKMPALNLFLPWGNRDGQDGAS